jgi:putative integral membrane protein (TIGR02587 family)
MEMWWFGQIFSAERVLVLLALTVAVVSGCLLFSGFRQGENEPLHEDVPLVLGVGVAVSAVTLLATGRIVPETMPLPVAARMVAIQAIPCAIGAALATTQLKPRRHADHSDRRIKELPEDLQKVAAAAVGGIFFAFNIAPTEEVRKMAIEIPAYLLPVLAALSMVAASAIVFLADFSERPPGYERGLLGRPLAEASMSYVVSLAISYGFLWAFGHVSMSTPFRFQLAATVVLAYVTSIGGAAGRVLVAEE